MRRHRGLAPLIGITVLAIAAFAFTLGKGYAPLLGLDLQGGVSVVLQPKGAAESDSLDQAVAIIRQRVDALGVAEPEITRQGNTILVQIPGVKDKDRAIELVGQTAELRFRPVIATLPPEAELQAQPQAGDGTTGTTVPADSSTPTTEAPPTSEGSLGLGGEGEHALGRQPTDTAPDSGSDATTPPTTAPGTTDTTAPPAGSGRTAASLLPADVCANGVPNDLDEPTQTVVLPQCQGDQLIAVYQLGPTLLTGDSLEGANAQLGQGGQWVVNPSFRAGADGIDKFNQAAAQCNAKGTSCPTGQLAIVLDGRVVSAPTIQQASFTRDQIQISGSFDEGSARDLATVLKYGALPVELEQQQAQVVSATLGRDALSAGLWAGLVGFILVAAYMIFFYRLLGVLAIAKLSIEAALLWSIISFMGETSGFALTLAGVTGLIVSIGVSVDSNVVYYEHLKEDVHRGRSLRSATDKAFSTSFRTIVAADFASLLGAFLLWWLTIGAVRGFALNLGIATILDLVCSYFFMRPAVALMLQSDMAAAHPRWFGLPEPNDRPAPSVDAPTKVGVTS